MDFVQSIITFDVDYLVTSFKLLFQLGGLKNTTGEEFGWDCDPLIPISVWASVLVGFGLQYFATTYV